MMADSGDKFPSEETSLSLHRENGVKRKLQKADKPDNNSKRKRMDDVVATTSAATEIKIVEFAACRAREIEAMTHSINTSSMNHRIYQRLPKHMRRRAMSHDPKRMPRRLRDAHIRELEMSKTKPISKRPSRRYRRRPKNLQAEYARRKRRVMWLETHIWHAKRFHMEEKWGYKIPLHPNDKGIRAAHRAVSKHCLLHDVSFKCCLEMSGQESDIISTFAHLSNKATGLSIGAKAVITGARQGTIILYQHDSYPYNVIGPAQFIWKPVESSPIVSKTDVTEGDSSSQMDTDAVNDFVEQKRHLWLWVHPASYQILLNELRTILGVPVEDVKSESDEGSKTTADDVTVKLETSDIDNLSAGQANVESKVGCKDIRPKSSPGYTDGLKSKKKTKNVPKEETVLPSNPSFGNDKVKVVSLKDDLVRFRLTGPLSQIILGDLLSVADVDSAAGSEPDANWWEKYYSKSTNYHHHDLQSSTWDLMKLAKSPSDCCSNAVVALTVRDPRVLLPKKKMYFTGEENNKLEISSEDTLKLCSAYPLEVSMSSIWDSTIRKATNKKMSTHELNEKRSKLLVPGTSLRLGAEESRIPVLLLQNPGTRATGTRQTDHSLNGYGCGWDLVVPAGWGMPFWLGLIFRGARASGVRELDSLSMEMRSLCYPRDYPDSNPAKIWAIEHKEDLETEYCKKPPSKRPNLLKLNVHAPFHSPWSVLVSYWMKHSNGSALKCTETAIPGPSDDHKVGEFFTVRDQQKLEALSKFCCAGAVKKSHDVPCITDLSSASALKEDFEHLQDALVSVTLAMFGRGSPTEMAMICMPSQKDMDMLVKDKQYGGPCEPRVKVKKAPKPSTKKDKIPRNILPELHPETVVNSCTRKVIGFLTDGKFSLARGSGLGQGFCAVQGLLQLKDYHRTHGQLLVLVRDPNSFQYRFGMLNILRS